MNISIIGAGAMGSGIAQLAAAAGNQVKIFDNEPTAWARSKKQMEKILSRQVEKERMKQEEVDGIFDRIKAAANINDLAKADLVIEAIVEDLAVKKAVFQLMEGMVSPDCILATNTSCLSVSGIAAVCEKPERVLGIHFFNPAPLMKLVEIIPALQTNLEVVKKSREIVESWNKITVLAKDTPGFIVNRIARPFYGESLRILEEGVADATTIDWALMEIGGFRMGPFALMDYIGHDVNYTVTETVFKAFYFDERYKPSFTQKRLVDAGYLGRKTGRGFYDYSSGAAEPVPKTNRKLGQRIVDRVLVMLINEAADALFLQIASREDIDMAMRTGVNYPKGLLAWADEIGIEACVHLLDDLFDEYRESRYRCSPLLRRMAREGKNFYD